MIAAAIAPPKQNGKNENTVPGQTVFSLRLSTVYCLLSTVYCLVMCLALALLYCGLVLAGLFVLFQLLCLVIFLPFSSRRANQNLIGFSTLFFATLYTSREKLF
jgi:hypothetical protein